ncbi:MAG: DUF3300 domain-containing protein [Holophaga sp.]|jgi:hypothetical protein
MALLIVACGSNVKDLSSCQAHQAPVQAPPAPAYTQQNAEQLQQLVAPIALYPDSLVAQVLASSTFPEEVVEADRWIQAHPGLKGAELDRAVDQQPWDPSVKALTTFPAVLGNMDKNLSWTSSLGDAYYNQQPEVMDAVQVMRRRAQSAGTLRSTPQQSVAAQGATVTIDPVGADDVYVPAYDPWLVYGDPIDAWPGWYPYPGIWNSGLSLSFGLGFGIGFSGGFAWGWPHWGFDWQNRAALFDHNRYSSRSATFFNRSSFYRGTGRGGTAFRPSAGGRSYARNDGAAFNRSGAAARPFNGNAQAARGYAEPRGQGGVRSGAFGGYQRGGQVRNFSTRGGASMERGSAHAGGGASMGRGSAHAGGGARRF